MKKTFYTLFFSFKGGVGRTSALMNTALYLARKKKRVLVIDFDLHAPGVDAFDVADDDLVERIPSYNPIKIYKHYSKKNTKVSQLTEEEIRKKAPQGMVELFAYWLDHEGNLPPLEIPSEDICVDWQKENKYVYRLPRHELGDGDIFVIRAGNHDDREHYTKTLQMIDHHNAKFDPGFGVFQYGERIFERDLEHPKRQRPEFVYDLQTSIENELRPDYVLIDSRPGNDWVSALAKTWLSECVVLTFNLNPWNMNGIIDVYNEMLQTPYHRNTPNMLLLVTPIPRYARTSKLYAGQHQVIQDKMKEARNSGRGAEGAPVEVPYAEILALRDVLITDAQESDPAVDSYKRLGDLIISGNVNDLENRIKAAYGMREANRIITAFTRLLIQYHQEIPLLFEYGKYLYSMNLLRDAEEKFDTIWRLLAEGETGTKDTSKGRISNPYYQDTLYNLGKVKIALAQDFIDREIISSQQKGESRYSEALKHLENINSLNRDVQLFNTDTKEWGEFSAMYGLLGDLKLIENSLMEFVQSEKRFDRKSKAFQCLVDAANHYQKAIDTPGQRNEEYLRGKANALAQQALYEPIDVNAINEAIATYKETTRMRSDNPSSYLQLGRYHLILAAIKEKEYTNQNSVLSFSDHAPFVESAVRFEGIVCRDLSSYDLEQAEMYFNYTIQFRPHESFAYFNRGVVKILQAGIRLGDKELQSAYELIGSANSDFSQASLYQSGYSPSYFYNGMSQFLIHYYEAGSLSLSSQNAILHKPGMSEIRFRQAFYQLELFIDQQLKIFIGNYIKECFWDEKHLTLKEDLLNELDDLIKTKNEEKDPFYFDPDDINEIQDRSLDFLCTIEFYMNFPGILEIILNPLVVLSKDRNFIYLIANHLEKDRKLNLDKNREHPVRQANLFGNRIRSLVEKQKL